MMRLRKTLSQLLKHDRTLSAARRNLRRAIADGSRVPLPDAGRRWGSYSEQTRTFAKNAVSALEVVSVGQNWQGSYESRHSGEGLIDYAKMIDASLLSQFPDFSGHLRSFDEVPHAPPGTVASYGGRRVSSAVLGHTMIIMRCLKYVRPRIVLDIGGGTGSTGRLWLTNSIHRPACYIDLDLPESLFYAECYIRSFVPDADIRYVHDASDLKLPLGASGRPTVLLIPVHNHPMVDNVPVDLITNSGSLQEMTTEYVDFYMNLIERSRATYFYSSNYFAQRIHVLIESMNYAAPVLGSNWRTLYQRYRPDPDRGVAELMFERGVSILDRRIFDDGFKINSVDAFLAAFIAVRASESAEQIMQVVAKAKQGLPFIPKELFYLTKRALQFDPGSQTIRDQLAELEQAAAIGVQNVGMIGAPLPHPGART